MTEMAGNNEGHEIRGMRDNHTINQLRCVAIILIVLHHCITLWPTEITIECQSWSVRFLTHMFKTSGLAIFTFVSGWLLCHTSDKIKNIKGFVIKKAERLLLPALFWGFLYHAIFSTGFEVDELTNVPVFINGNHLWYLPMLFFCMLTIIPLLFRFRFQYLAVTVIYLAITSLMHRNRTLFEYAQYFPIFLLGYFMCKIQELVTWLIKSMVGVIVSICLIICYLWMIFKQKDEVLTGFLVTHVLVSVAFFIAFQHINIPFRNAVTFISKTSFAIYLMHQFVINWTWMYVGHMIECLDTITGTLIFFIPALLIPMAVKLIWRKLV